jgi:hypothetical protein
MMSTLLEIKNSFRQEENNQAFSLYNHKDYSVIIQGQNNSYVTVHKIIEWKLNGNIELITDEGSIFYHGWDESIEIVELVDI